MSFIATTGMPPDLPAAIQAARRIVEASEEVITVAQAADEACVSDTTIRAWMKKGLVEYTRRGDYCGDLVVAASLRMHLGRPHT